MSTSRSRRDHTHDFIPQYIAHDAGVPVRPGLVKAPRCVTRRKVRIAQQCDVASVPRVSRVSG